MKRTEIRTAKSIQQGFTLIELLVVVAIIALLTAIALPNYSAYVTRSKIPDATSNLANLRVRMEQYYQDNSTYVGADTTPIASPICPTSANANTSLSQYFNFSCTAVPTSTTYTIQAVGKNTMLGFTYTVNQSNVKATTAVPASPTGWVTNASCWVTNKGGKC
jgi:type IV pilus assembly protein PilE